MADDLRRDRDGERDDRDTSNDRAARDGGEARVRAADAPQRAPLTRRERDERWPIG